MPLPIATSPRTMLSTLEGALTEPDAAAADEQRLTESPRPPVSVTVHALADAELDALWRREGKLWGDWIRLWQGLKPEERDAAAHPAWLTAWLTHYALPSERDFRLFVCRAADTLLAVLPFEVLPKQTPIGRVCQLRLESAAPLEGGSLAVRAGDLNRLFRAIFENSLDGRMRPAAIVLDQVDETHALLKWTGLHCRADEIQPRSVIDLPEGYDALLESLSSNFRGNLRKARNKLNKLGAVRLDEIASPEELANGLSRFAEVERRSWKAREGTDLAADAALSGFYGDALPPLAAAGEALIHVLHVNGADLAAQIAVRWGDRLDVHKISYVEEYQDIAPGNLLLELVMRDAAPRLGIRRVNLVTHLPWHARWNPGVIRTFRTRIFPQGVRGAWTRLWLVPPKERARAWLDRAGLLEWFRDVRSRRSKGPSPHPQT